MDRKFLLFITLSFVMLTANALWNARNAPKQPVPAPGAAAPGAAGQEDAGKAPAEAPAAAADGKAAEGDKPAPAEGAVAQAEAPVAEGDAAVTAAPDANPAEAEPATDAAFVTLGSVDPTSPYRMLVTITNEGAAVRRIELSNPRYLDLQDRGGYLGRLELKVGDGEGLLVQAVGMGTPANQAGLLVGDRLVGAGVSTTVPLASADELTAILAKAKPNNELLLDVLRDGGKQTLTAKLRRAPLDVIRPESENMRLRGAPLPVDFVEPPSFLLTLQSVDKQSIAPKASELAGVDLTTAAWRITQQSPDEVTFERRLPKRGLVITKHYKLAKVEDGELTNLDAKDYHLTLDVTIANEAGDAAKAHDVSYRLDGPNGLPIEGWWYATKVSRVSGGLRDVIARNFDFKPDQKSSSKIAAGTPQPFESGSLAYIGVDAQYFAAAMLPVKTDPQEEWIASAEAELVGPIPDAKSIHFANLSYRLVTKPVSIEPGKNVTHSYTIFAGPKRPTLLSKYDAADNPVYSLNDFVYYGWFGDVAKAMVGLLHIFYGVVRNYGIAIIMLTALVRGCMFPVSRGQARSMAKLNDLKPEMERIKEKYKGDQQKQAKAMQDLYRKHKVNPLGGCLPALIQLPVFIGLYRGLAVDVELRQAPLFGSFIRWCSNLAAPDMFYNWSSFMPTLITNSLGPYLNLLPLVTITLFLLQQKMFMPEPTNEQAAMQQKIMKYMMIFMAFMFYKVPSGLCLYFIASSLWGIGERKLFPPPSTTIASGPTLAIAGGGTRGSGGDGDAKRAVKNGQAGASRGGKAKRKK